MPHVLEGGLARAGGRTPARPSRATLDEREQAFADETLVPATRVLREDESGPDLYRCQATDIKQASRQLRMRELDQYTRGLRNWKLPKLFVGLFSEAINEWQAFSRNRLPKWTWIARAERFPFVLGKLEKGKTPKGEPLNLQPGDLVRVKSKREIVATLDQHEPQPGPVLRPRDGPVLRPHRPRPQPRDPPDRGEERRDGRDQVRLHHPRRRRLPGDFHRFCTRGIYHYWREIWLERIDAPDDHVPDAPCVATRWSRD